MAAERPSIRVLLAGAVGVVTVVAFVAAVTAGSHTEPTPGERVAVIRSAGPAGMTVLAGRCTDQRVTEVSMSSPQGALWRITSEDGSIDRRYVVGGEPPPLGFVERVKLTGVPAGPVLVRVKFSRDGHADGGDVMEVDPGDIEGPVPTLGDAAPPCAVDSGLGGVTALLFGVGAGAVVLGYLAMVRRRWRP